MTKYRDPNDSFAAVAELVFFTFLCAGLGLCLGVGFVLAVTILPGENLSELLFWPMIGTIAFIIALLHLWATQPWDYTNTEQK